MPRSSGWSKVGRHGADRRCSRAADPGQLGSRRRPWSWPTAVASTPTSWCSPPGCVRATSWPARPGSPSASGAASSWTTRAARRTPAVWAIGECACIRGPLLRARGARVHHGRGRRRPAARRRGDVPGRRHVHQAQAARRRRGQLRRRVRDRPARSTSCTPTRWPASTRSWCSPTTPARCSAASSSGTPSPYAALRPLSGSPSSGATRRPGSLPEGAAPRLAVELPADAAVCSCNA